MKNTILALIVMILFISCNENKTSDSALETVITNIRNTQEQDDIEYELLGDPETNESSTIKVMLHNTKIADLDKEAKGKEIAKRVFKASPQTEKYSVILIEFINKSSENGTDTKHTRHFVYNTSEF